LTLIYMIKLITYFDQVDKLVKLIKWIYLALPVRSLVYVGYKKAAASCQSIAKDN
jgi:hypothetical protein